ncbi:hypothetical protein ATPR_3448 [Acetobacter tropicalis NBRC 101654]|uniref:Uncharacterized protein n=1 Tax=Acetobacter tropicalis NBRC 101654 TaxID=749388 RepID=F7VJ99_9PROT|nr:hypothetical protein ATPR_3448 [Acetobacter tropicalis NBRC 101654]
MLRVLSACGRARAGWATSNSPNPNGTHKAEPRTEKDKSDITPAIGKQACVPVNPQLGNAGTLRSGLWRENHANSRT